MGNTVCNADLRVQGIFVSGVAACLMHSAEHSTSAGPVLMLNYCMWCHANIFCQILSLDDGKTYSDHFPLGYLNKYIYIYIYTPVVLFLFETFTWVHSALTNT